MSAAAVEITDQANDITLRVASARVADSGRGIVRVSAALCAELGLVPGDAVQVIGAHPACAVALPGTGVADGTILMDSITRNNTGTRLGDDVALLPVQLVPALAMTLTPATADRVDMAWLQKALRQRAVCAGQKIRLDRGGQTYDFTVTATTPALPVTLTAHTEITLSQETDATAASGIGFEDIGGLGAELARIRETVELPLVRPELFERLGITPPRGVLLSGPPGSGKTLIARALAQEARASFFDIAGPEIADKHFGASEGKLRDVFEAARKAAPAIIFIDEIESIAPRRDSLSDDRQVERRLVAQLLTLMDGLDTRGHVVVLAATNLPDLIDPALRRPGRFDREIILRAPDVRGRQEILAIHTRGMPLAADVNLAAIAGRTHGFVGADLASLVREAGMATLRRACDLPVDQLTVSAADFEAAATEVIPSALRSVAVDIPEVSWDDVAGCAQAKTELRQAIEWPLVYPENYARLGLRSPKGVILHGPPGTGKTLLARALAGSADANFIAVKGGEMLSMYLGESERAVREIFTRARQTAPTVIFFDEMDALAPARNDRNSETADRVVAQLLTEMDGLSAMRGVLVVAATNRLDRIDPALLRPGRFDLLVPVGLPTVSDRAELFTVHLKKTAHDVLDLAALADLTDGFSGAEIEWMVRRAAQLCLARLIAAGPSGDALTENVTMADIETAIAARVLQGAQA